MTYSKSAVFSFALSVTSLASGSSPLAAQTPVAGSQSQEKQVLLSSFWDTSSDESTLTRKELKSLLGGFGSPSTDKGGAGAEIYEGITYLMPLKEAIIKLNLKNRMSSKERVATPGFPKNSFYSYDFAGTYDNGFNHLFIVTYYKDQVVCLQFVAPGSLKVKGHQTHIRGKMYNFVNNKWKALSTAEVEHGPQRSGDAMRLDSVLLQGGQLSKAQEYVRWYVPKPLANLILHCCSR